MLEEIYSRTYCCVNLTYERRFSSRSGRVPHRFEQKHFFPLEVLKKFGVNPKRRSIQSKEKNLEDDSEGIWGFSFRDSQATQVIFEAKCRRSARAQDRHRVGR